MFSKNRILAILLASATFLSTAPATPPAATDNEKHISVYSPVAVYTLPVLDRAGHEYVGLLELLEPLGRVSSQSEAPQWRLHYNAVDAEFTAGKTRARIRGRDFDFTAPFLLESARGFVPSPRSQPFSRASSEPPSIFMKQRAVCSLATSASNPAFASIPPLPPNSR